MDIDAPLPPHDSDEDFGSEVLSKFNISNNECHMRRHWRHITGAEGPKPPSHSRRLLRSHVLFPRSSTLINPLVHIIDALLTILYIVIHRFSFPTVLEKKYTYLSDLVIQILRLKSVGFKVSEQTLKFVLPLLTVRHKIVWNDISQSYDVLISYVTDERSQVRKHSTICISQVLQTFGSTRMLAPLLAPASEAITKVFEIVLLLAEGSNENDTEGPNENDTEGPKGAQEVLYVLDAFKTCLPFMSSKSLDKILKHFKSLLEVRQSLVTRHATDAFDNLCRHNREEVNGEVLVDPLCSLATMLSLSESSADSMTFIARLLGNGMETMYLLNRQIFVVKIPVVFNALTGVLASGHEEGPGGSGENGVTENAYATRKSGPTVIEKLCATTESRLDYQYKAIWDMSFQIVSTMFEKLGKYSFHFLKGGLKNLAEIQKLPDEDFTLRKQGKVQTGRSESWSKNDHDWSNYESKLKVMHHNLLLNKGWLRNFVHRFEVDQFRRTSPTRQLSRNSQAFARVPVHGIFRSNKHSRLIFFACYANGWN